MLGLDMHLEGPFGSIGLSAVIHIAFESAIDLLRSPSVPFLCFGFAAFFLPLPFRVIFFFFFASIIVSPIMMFLAVPIVSIAVIVVVVVAAVVIIIIVFIVLISIPFTFLVSFVVASVGGCGGSCCVGEIAYSAVDVRHVLLVRSEFLGVRVAVVVVVEHVRG